MKRIFGTLGLALLMAAGACDSAEDADANAAADSLFQNDAPIPQMDSATMAQMQQVQQIQAQLQPIQQQALEDEELAAQVAALQTRMETAVRNENPEAMDRFEQLRSDLSEAQAAGDQQRMQSLVMEGQGVQRELQMAQMAVAERPEIKRAIEAFQAAQRERMIEIDPQAERLLDRLDSLIAVIRQ